MHGIVTRTYDSQSYSLLSTIITPLGKSNENAIEQLWCQCFSHFYIFTASFETHSSYLDLRITLLCWKLHTGSHFLDVSYTDRGVDDDHVPMKHVADTLAHQPSTTSLCMKASADNPARQLMLPSNIYDIIGQQDEYLTESWSIIQWLVCFSSRFASRRLTVGVVGVCPLGYQVG